ncbi:MAG: acetate kinase [Clostridia bacterium]|nr:acetate kinase [Clostridia bacterium]
MKILVINSGSSSVKYQLFDMETESVLAKGLCERIGIDGRFTHKWNGQKKVVEVNMPDHSVAMKHILDALVSKECGVISSLNEIDAIGNRIVQGGAIFKKSELVTDEVVEQIRSLIPLAPLHNKAHILGIEACRKLLPQTPQVVVFDTVFHTSTMPEYAYRYAVDQTAYKEWDIRKYGFHGSSHKYVSEILAEKMGFKGKFIVCHIGNGSSLCAVKDGKCQDTSMGFTPLEGLIMGSRSGDIDPSVLATYCEKTGKSVAEAVTWLNKKCGLLGVSGVSEDMRDIEAIAYSDEVSERADNCRLALDMCAYRIKKYIGSYMAVLGGCDAIAFTAGVGENGPEFREKVCRGLEGIGIVLDYEQNAKTPKGAEVELTGKGSKTRIFVIPTNEEIMIARETKDVVLGLNK